MLIISGDPDCIVLHCLLYFLHHIISISFNCSDTVMSRPFPHSCKKRHQVVAWVDKIQWFVWNCSPAPPQASTSIFLCLLTAVECGKGLLGRKVMIFVFLHLCFLSPISPQNSSARFLAFSSQKSGRNFSYELKAKLVPVTGLIWRRPQKNIRTKYIKRYHHYQCQIKGWPNKTIN